MPRTANLLGDTESRPADFTHKWESGIKKRVIQTQQFLPLNLSEYEPTEEWSVAGNARGSSWLLIRQ